MKWQVIADSVMGASHESSGLTNQDAVQWSPESREGPPIILAISDGHGSANSFRSHKGSQIAVAVAREALEDFWLQIRSESRPDLVAIERCARERLPAWIAKAWRLRVLRHFQMNPTSDEEVAKLTGRTEDPEASLSKLRAAPTRAYGATLLGVLVANDFVLYLQLGDGDILNVDANGVVSRPIPRDERLIANETTSLCSSDAERSIHLAVLPAQVAAPSLILASTDGYANSFKSDEDFTRIGSDLLRNVQTEGLDAVAGKIGMWAQEASRAGSGDDITLGLIAQAELQQSRILQPVFQPVAPKLSPERARGDGSDSTNVFMATTDLNKQPAVRSSSKVENLESASERNVLLVRELIGDSLPAELISDQSIRALLQTLQSVSTKQTKPVSVVVHTLCFKESNFKEPIWRMSQPQLLEKTLEGESLELRKIPNPIESTMKLVKSCRESTPESSLTLIAVTGPTPSKKFQSTTSDLFEQFKENERFLLKHPTGESSRVEPLESRSMGLMATILDATEIAERVIRSS